MTRLGLDDWLDFVRLAPIDVLGVDEWLALTLLSEKYKLELILSKVIDNYDIVQQNNDKSGAWMFERRKDG